MLKLISYLLLLVFLISCQKKVYNSEICNDLSIKSYKGMPKAAHEFQENCQNVPIKYTQEICKKALNVLIFTGNLAKVKEEFGDKALECFTENDLKKFLPQK